MLLNGEYNLSLVIVRVSAKYTSEWNKKVVPFINDLNEKEGTELEFNIYVN